MKNLGKKLLSVGISMLMMSNCGSAVNCSAFGNNGNCDKIVNSINENFNRTLGILNEEINGYKLKLVDYERKIEGLEKARDEAARRLSYCEGMQNKEAEGNFLSALKILFAIEAAHLAFPMLRNLRGVFQMQVHF